MMVHRSHGKGSFVIDRRFANVLGTGQSRVRVASGVTDPETFRLMNAMLTVFARRRPEILEDLRDKRVTPLQAFRWWESGEWERIPSGRHLRPLRASLEAWVVASETRAKQGKGGRENARGRRDVLRALGGLLAPAMTLSDLPIVLRRYRGACETRGVAAAFNHAKTHAQAFLRDTLRRSDPLYREVVDVAPLPVERKIPHAPQSVASARRIAELLGPAAGACWWSMCVTGMNPKEYFEDGWVIRRDLGVVEIHGKKRRSRVRLVPLLEDPVVPTLGRQGFKSALRRRVVEKAGIRVAPMDARRTFANWLVEAGIPSNWRRAYRGHSAADMGQLYEEPLLRADMIEKHRTALKALLGIDVAGLRLA